ncbi:nucleotide sugar dehydrogenase [Coralloluteibacterium stylophorae]|uniref:Nucleotide sugar dehydrogenase n=1 Tax=Coralloluteibacterium stylophorae TaxID=1776034 RepID=A0A8J7VX36_9GAMM|nr:nucleotide sugar dehydrogenase [Coralloluteibacterium stylophorae]
MPQVESARIAVIGLGYVGLPLAAAFARAGLDTVGFDIDPARVAELAAGRDRTGELDADELAHLAGVRLAADPAVLADRDVFVVAVPTPVDRRKLPDLGPMLAATRTVAAHLRTGAVVVYESTVYPGATEEACVPVLERASGLACGRDFAVGYSPERINPGDRTRRLPDIVKVVSASSPDAAAFLEALYARVVPAGIHVAPDIRTAEAAKAIENTQRDVNIALVNELAMVFARLGMDTEAVLAAARTKWNFLPFSPGLVGGHCIGVDPYYLIHKATEAGHVPDLITAARRVNEGMAPYVAAQLIRLMARAGRPIAGGRVLVLGVTFKEDCPDLRNSQVGTIVEELRACRIEVDLHDPWADAWACEAEFGLAPVAEPAAAAYDAVLLAVAHREFRERGAGLRRHLVPGGVLYDVKRVLPREAADARL